MSKLKKEKSISELMVYIHEYTTRQGFYDEDKILLIEQEMKNKADIFILEIVKRLMLANTEITEAVEELRMLDINWNKFAEEIADTVIRLFDTAEWLGIDLYKQIIMKMKKNEKRPKYHNKRF